ncbi:MAG: polysaccharide biosynthesis/export family protein [Bacteroidaceae bacterium]|nr:polysaccharide biosynthesis/export family protein [Bacteroidaceae bacterium]
MVRKHNVNILLFLLLIFSASCTSYKNVPYMQNSEELAKIVQQSAPLEVRVQPKDIVTIMVISPEEPSLSAVYNFTASMPYESSRGISTATQQPTIQPYLVDSEGYINFPVIGKLHVAGKTRSEVENLVLDKIKGAFKKPPLVTMRFDNFKISVLGEVNSPGSFTIKNERVNIFEALALARDLTIYGKRDNVMLVREYSDGKKEIHTINLNDVAILTSPYYYLQQNDILYVTPNKTKAKNSDIGSSTSLWFSATSILISLTSLLYNILR